MLKRCAHSYIPVLIALALLAQIGWSTPTSAQIGPPRAVHIRVYVFNTRTSSAVPSVVVYFAQPRTASCPTGAASYATTSTEGVADIYVNACAGSGEVYSYGSDTVGVGGVSTNALAGRNQQFQGGAGFVTVANGESSYLVRFGMTPSENNEGQSSELRELHIRVLGRGTNGTLVAVHFATVYDAQGNHIATTDYNGIATAAVRAPMGETVRMTADGGSRWGEGSSSYIVGASEGGTRLTRADDYINFVLKGTGEENAEDVEFIFNVQGQAKNGRVPVHFASIYDGQGRHLVTTDYDGHATVSVKVPANGEPYVVRVDAGSRWKPASKEIFGGPRGSNGAIPYNLSGGRSVSFLLEPATEGKELTVEVLDHDTGKPLGSATVTIYKPNNFPGTPVAHSGTNSEGIATFSAAEVEEAMLNGSAHIGAAANGSESSVQTLSSELLSGESPKYVLYLREKQTKWSGTWYQGPYVVHVSGGQGSMSYTFLRESDMGTCCPTTDKGSGTCTVKGNIADCQAEGTFHNSASEIHRTEHVTLTYQGDYISVKSLILSSQEKTDKYHPCPESGPEMSKCTSLYEGNTLTGTWSRQKPQ